MSEPGKEERPAANGAELPATTSTKPQSTRFATIGLRTVDLDAIGAGSSNPRYEVLLRGFSYGYESRQGEVDRLNWEADLWYWCYTNRKSPAEFYVHATDELWTEAAA